jgi:hypothetical protein
MDMNQICQSRCSRPGCAAKTATLQDTNQGRPEEISDRDEFTAALWAASNHQVPRLRPPSRWWGVLIVGKPACTLLLRAS